MSAPTKAPPTAPLERRTSATSAQISSIANKVGRALSPNRTLVGGMERRVSLGGAMQSDLESQRGRVPIVSTGRGGAGNLLRSPSRGVDQEVMPGMERGREGATQRDLSGDRAVRSGRGGAGNIRSPSRDPTNRIADEDNETSIQERLIAEQRGRQAEGAFSTGRGGAGNFSRDKSRSRSAVRGESVSAAGAPVLGSPVNGKEPHAHQVSGRGGWGNVREERESVDLEKEAAAHRYEAGLAAKYRAEDAGKIHSSGKGGAGNMTTKHLTPEELSKLNAEERDTFNKLQAAAAPHYSSGGRGGAGNYHARDRDAVDGDRGRDGKQHNGIFGSVMRSLSRAKGGSNERAKD